MRTSVRRFLRTNRWTIISVIVTWLIVMGLLFFAEVTLGAQIERRTAEAAFRQVNSCEEVVSLLTITQNTAPDGLLTQAADGFVRTATLTVEVNDTCAGTQQLNAAGQANFLATELNIDRRLESAAFTGWLDVWDGISQTQGRFWVEAGWTGVGTMTRSWRNSVRNAEATLAADGFGLQLRNATTEARLSTEISK